MIRIAILFAFAILTAPMNLAQNANRGTTGTSKVVPMDAVSYTPTPTQQTQLELKQKDAIIATQKLQLLQQQVQTAEVAREQALGALNAQAEAVKKENKWDAKTDFDPNDLKFSQPKAADKPAPPAKP